METFYETKYHLLEKEQWWFRSRRDAIIRIVKNIDRHSRILDVGCSTGLLLEELRSIGYKNLYGIDISEKAVEASLKRGFKNSFVMNGEDPLFEPESFDLIISSDSLEHMENDEKAIKNWSELLKPEGKLVVFVPAFMFLWSNHDVVNQHYRRYTRKSLKQKILKERFTIKISGYWNFSLFFPVALLRVIKNNIGMTEQASDLNQTPAIINTSLYALLKVENMIFSKIGFPIGVSTFCVAEKQIRKQ